MGDFDDEKLIDQIRVLLNFEGRAVLERYAKQAFLSSYERDLILLPCEELENRYPEIPKEQISKERDEVLRHVREWARRLRGSKTTHP